MAATGDAAISQQVQSRRRRLLRIAIWVGGVTLAIFILDLIGIPVSDWIHDLFEKVREVPPWAVVSGSVLQTVQTALVALAWLGILRAAFPRDPIPYRVVLACYATAVALNGFLPANLGTFVMLAMFTTLFASATFAAVFSGLVVQKIPFSVFNIALYLYLFLSVAGSFSIKLGFLADHTGPDRPDLRRRRGAARDPGPDLLGADREAPRATDHRRRHSAQPAPSLCQVALPELGSYLARLGVIAVFLGAYGIPVTFHNVATVTASNSISNSVSVTPGGVGVNQAMNTAVLKKETGAGQRDRLLRRTAADHHRLERGLRGDHGLLGVRVDGRQGAGRVLLWRCEGTQPRDERGAQEAEAREAGARGSEHG